jgi:hypothetical protein
MLSRRVHFAFVFGTAAVMLVGCVAPSDQSSSLGSAQSSLSNAQSLLFSFLRRMERPPARAKRRATWIAPEAKVRNLLYVSDGGAREVVVYSYPAGELVGELTNLDDPAGACSDAQGNVWIVNSASFQIVEFAHGGKRAKARLSDYGAANPLGCAVDPTTGNLAVTNVGTASGGGGFSIYAGAKGSAENYQDSDLMYAYFCGYDNEGNLFIDGLNGAYSFVLVELPSGSETPQTISLSGNVAFPGGVAWDGKYMAIGDQYYQGKRASAIFQYSVAGSAGTLEGTTTLTDSCDALQFAISSRGMPRKDQQGKAVVVPDACLNSAAFYGYPAGGSPTETLSGLEYPVAAAVSRAHS